MAREINFYQVFSCEFYKILRNKWILLASAIPSVFVVIAFIYFGYHEYPAKTFSGAIYYTGNSWESVMNILFKCYQFTFSLIIVIIAGYCFYIEKCSEGIRLFHSLPCRKEKVLFAKYVALLSFITLFILTAWLLFLTGVKFFELFYPGTVFDLYDMRLNLMIFFAGLTFQACCIAMIQYGLSVVFNNYLFPVFLALLLIMFTDEESFVILYSPGGYIDMIFYNFSLYGMTFDFQISLKQFIIPIVTAAVSFIDFQRLLIKYKFNRKWMRILK